MSKQKADLSDGYTRIANTLIDALIERPFTLRETKVLLFIMRSTYGYQHKERPLSHRFIADGTGIDYKKVAEVISHLEAKKIISRVKAQGQTPQVISINTRINEWLLSPKKEYPKLGESTLPQKGDTTLPQKGDNIKKELNKEYMCVGENPPRHTFEDFSTFDSLWEDWKFSRAGKDKISKAQKNKIIEIGYDRMTEARKKYEAEFAARTSKNNVPLSARSWFGGAYEQYVIVEKTSNGYYRNELGQLVDSMTGEICE